MNEKIERFIITLAWYLVFWGYYWHNLLVLSPAQLEGYGIDDKIWESTFVVTSLFAGFFLGRTRREFNFVNSAKNAFLHVAILGGVSLLILIAMYGTTVITPFHPYRLPIFTLTGMATLVSASYTGYHYNKFSSQPPDGGSGSEDKEPYFSRVEKKAIIGGIIASLISGAITAMAGTFFDALA